MIFKIITRRRNICFKTCLALTVTLVVVLWFLKKTGEIGLSIKDDLQETSALEATHNSHNAGRPIKYRKTVVQGWLDDKIRNTNPIPDFKEDYFLPRRKVRKRSKKEEEYEAMIKLDLAKIIPGLGNDGAAVDLIGDEAKKAKEVMKKEAFNLIASDKVAYDRTVKDARHPLCKSVQYDEDLPSASVVIIFNNEAWSSLIRTVHSVLNGSPARHLTQIVLVDDASDREELLGKLEYYIRTRLPRKVILQRLSERNGLIRARLHGAKVATGEILVFLDSHCEVGPQWLEPLLQRIKEKRTAVVVPIIDVIDDQTLEYMHNLGSSLFQVGGFSWSGHFTWHDIPDRELNRRGSSIAPTWSPTMAGGLFAMDSDYFWESGSYDEQMELWGGENLEMSFRIWQCGGTIETIPCSRVGHIFRSFHPYSFPGHKDTHGINTARTVEVWMDHYKELFYLHRPDLREVDIGNLTQRQELRKKLKCKNFKWFLDNIYPEKFVLNEDVQAYGRVRNKMTELCFDTLQHGEDTEYDIGVYSCHNTIYSSQLYSFSKEGQIRREETCGTITSNNNVRMEKCFTNSNRQLWRITESGQLRSDVTELCLDAAGLASGDTLKAMHCSDSPTQLWTWDYYLEAGDP